MKNVTIKLTGGQAILLLEILRSDTYKLKRDGFEERFILQNNRIEERIIKGIIEAEGHP